MGFISKRGALFLLVPGFVVVILVAGTMAMERQEENARVDESRSVQSAVIVMMVDNDLRSLPHPVVEPTADMTAFPDASTSPLAKGLDHHDRPGYVLRNHVKAEPGGAMAVIHYISVPFTEWTYAVAADGTVTQGSRR